MAIFLGFFHTSDKNYGLIPWENELYIRWEKTRIIGEFITKFSIDRKSVV